MCRKVIISRNGDNNDAFLLIYLHQSLLLLLLTSSSCQLRLHGPSVIYLANIYSPRHGRTVTDQDERQGKNYRKFRRYEMAVKSTPTHSNDEAFDQRGVASRRVLVSSGQTRRRK